jgi:hypothetical protein
MSIFTVLIQSSIGSQPEQEKKSKKAREKKASK